MDTYQRQQVSHADEVAQSFKEQLQDLKDSARSKINALTEIADSFRQFAEPIAQVIVQHIVQSSVAYKFPALYVLDCIVKFVGQPYNQLFEPHLQQVYKSISEAAPALQAKLDRTVDTWKGFFSDEVLGSIRADVVSEKIKAGTTKTSLSAPEEAQIKIKQEEQSNTVVVQQQQQQQLQQIQQGTLSVGINGSKNIVPVVQQCGVDTKLNQDQIVFSMPTTSIPAVLLSSQPNQLPNQLQMQPQLPSIQFPQVNAQLLPQHTHQMSTMPQSMPVVCGGNVLLQSLPVVLLEQQQQQLQQQQLQPFVVQQSLPPSVSSNQQVINGFNQSFDYGGLQQEMVVDTQYPPFTIIPPYNTLQQQQQVAQNEQQTKQWDYSTTDFDLKFLKEKHSIPLEILRQKSKETKRVFLDREFQRKHQKRLNLIQSQWWYANQEEWTKATSVGLGAKSSTLANGQHSSGDGGWRQQGLRSSSR
eukprot:TRINITY_DN2755_c0_g2_i2.p1 TRINITY_DN2755_c0_g2~~TRINITY_DN2755_c0_g2_i2.p1  ORF type:complete len:501 (+),score=53.86 TRINITY_DN2755_c0_g2_i2:92-1504(+)